MAPRSKSILKPPSAQKPQERTASVICGYIKALDEECARILKEEGITVNEDNLTRVLSELEAQGANQ